MTTLRDIKKRLHSAANIQHITKAMEMVAAVRLRKALNKLELFRPYAEKMHQMLQQLARASNEVSHPLFEERTERKKGVLIITADKGLCGAYNNNVIQAAEKLLRKDEYSGAVLFLVGNKAIEHFKKQPWEIKFSMRDLSNKMNASEVEKLSSFLVEGFLKREWDEITIVYTIFKNILSRQIRIDNFLPISKGEIDATAPSIDYIFEPSAEEIYSVLIPRYCFTRLMKVLSEAQVSELGARVTAMKAATKNADEMIEKLTLIRNKVRQAGITKEMLEITAGAEGLE
ncbi:MAG: ATP synthase F1 subunit gamma [Parachlamydiales bacterium]|jgi:F-type H+-transporting ATPase subunit gamma